MSFRQNLKKNDTRDMATAQDVQIVIIVCLVAEGRQLFILTGNKPL